MSSSSRAWVLDLGAGQRVAAGGRHIVEYLLSPESVRVPLVPAQCVSLMVWRERLIPLIDLAPVLQPRVAAAPGCPRAVVLAHQAAPRESLSYGALLVRAAPFEAWVSDDMARPLPEEPYAFRHFSCSCFDHEGTAVPILNVAWLFSRPLPWTVVLQDNVTGVERTTETTAALDRLTGNRSETG